LPFALEALLAYVLPMTANESPAPTVSDPASFEKPTQEPGKIRAMFSAIASRYDLMNHLLSSGIDILWRRRVAREYVTQDQRHILDLACGTGDLALEMRKRAHPDCHIYGADFTGAMLRLAAEKTPASARGSMTWIEGDGLRLPFPDARFDLLTIGFGIRNMASLDTALGEMYRVLRPGGRLVILEFTTPPNPLVRAVYMPYFLHVLPRIAALLSQRSAYLYLGKSVMNFPKAQQLGEKMVAQGFKEVTWRFLTFGIAAIHMGVRK